MKKDVAFTSLITITEAAQVLGVSNDTMRRWEREGKITSIRLVHNGKRRYKKEDIEKITRNGAQKSGQ